MFLLILLQAFIYYKVVCFNEKEHISLELLYLDKEQIITYSGFETLPKDLCLKVQSITCFEKDQCYVFYNCPDQILFKGDVIILPNPVAFLRIVPDSTDLYNSYFVIFNYDENNEPDKEYLMSCKM